MKVHKRIMIMLVVLLTISTVSQPLLQQAHAAGYTGARAAFSNGELFLGGNYMELGISKWGDFGTEGSKPANFNGTTKRSNIGMSVAHIGFGAPGAVSMDYYLPGTPEERFAVGYQVGTNKYSNSNIALGSPHTMPTVVTNESDVVNGKLKARITTTWTEKMEITQVVSFSENDKVFKNEVTIKNISTETWDNARYMRSLDPDNTVDIGGDYTTKNTVTHTIEEDGIALVKAEAKTGEPYPLFYYSSDKKAKGSIFGFANSDPYAAAAYDTPTAKGSVVTSDIGMTMTWETHNALAPNESETFIYYTSLDSRDPSDIIADIESPQNGFTESEENDGSVVGTHQVEIKGGRLQDTIDPSFLTVNNLPEGLSLGTVKRVNDTILEITLVGNAIHHESYNSITNASLTIGRENILVGIKEITSEPFNITFIDKSKAYIKSSTVTESVYGTGTVTGELSIDISDGYLKEVVTNADIIINQLPAGLTYNVERVSDKELKITVSGVTHEIVDVMDASVTIKEAVLVGSEGQDITTNTFYINFTDQEPYLFISNPILKESDANDGTFTQEIKLKLHNARFKDKSVIDEVYTVTEAVYGINLPVGIEIDNFTITSPTDMTVTLKGAAINAVSAANILNGQISINKGIVTINSPDLEFNAATINSNTIAFYFIDDAATIGLTRNELYVELDTTISETLILKSRFGEFDPSISLADITVNNLPTGVILKEVKLLNATELELMFDIPEADALVLDGTAQFASISIASGKVTNSTDRLTTETFKFLLRKYDDITWDAIKNANVLQTNVSFNLDLIKEVTGGKVTWTSSNPAIVSTEGIVTPSLTQLENVKLTASFMLDGVTVTREFDIVVSPPKLTITSLEVLEATPSEVEITFNQLLTTLDAEDFNGFTIDGKKVKAVKSISGNVAVIELETPLHAASALIVEYDSAEGNVLANNGANTELDDMTSADQGSISVTNKIEPFEIVTVQYKDGKLVLVFNKDVDPTTFNLDGLKLDGLQLTGSFKIVNNEVSIDVNVNLIKEGSELSYTAGAIVEKDNISNHLVLSNGVISLNKQKSYIDPKGQLTGPVVFQNDNNEAVQLTPAFDKGTGTYSSTLNENTQYVTLTSGLPLPSGTYAKVFFKGEEVDVNTTKFDLQHGSNLVSIKVYDSSKPHILLAQYDFNLLRHYYVVDVPKNTIEISGQINGNKNNVPFVLESNTENGKLVGHISIADKDASQIVEHMQDEMNRLIVIEVPQSFESDEFTLDIDKDAVTRLRTNNVIVEVRNQGAIATVNGATFEANSDDLYLRLIPLKEQEQQQQVKAEIQELANTKKINVVGQPLKVETNLDNNNVTLYLPLDGVKIPNNEAEKQQLFKRLGVYASYENGDNALITGTIVQREKDKYGIEFTMNQAGTFSLAAVSASADKYIIGYPDGEFKPNESVTRGQIALMFARNMDFVTTGEYTDQQYKDLSSKHYANQAVGFMSKMNLMNGYEDGTFKANKSMTRAEVMSIAIKYLGVEIDEAVNISFNDTTNHWARYIIEAARKLGLIDENENDFRPDEELTRLEAVKLINLLFEREPVENNSEPTFSDVKPGTPGFGQIEESVKEFSGVFIQVK